MSAEQYECPECKQALPFGKLTDACPKCAIRFDYGAPSKPVLVLEQAVAQQAEHAERPPGRRRSDAVSAPASSAGPDPIPILLASSGVGSLFGALFKAMRGLLGVSLLLLAVVLKTFARELHLVSTDRADLLIPGVLAAVGVFLLIARGKVAVGIATVLGALAIAFICFVVLALGAAGFSR